MSSAIYRKTVAGQSEIAQRAAGLSLATRTVLIMVNGKDTVHALSAKGLAQLNEHLDRLLGLGLIEATATTRLPAAHPPATEPTASRPAAPAAPTAEDNERLTHIQNKAQHVLMQHFGPDTPIVAHALLAATSMREFQQALDGIETRLAMYLGRKGAAREIAQLQP